VQLLLLGELSMTNGLSLLASGKVQTVLVQVPGEALLLLLKMLLVAPAPAGRLLLLG
jgi:hypothetical protein